MPGFPDLWGFGRRRDPVLAGEIERLVAYQIGAALALASYAGHRITYVNAHGTLANLAETDTRRRGRRRARHPRRGPHPRVAGDRAQRAGARRRSAPACACSRKSIADRAYTEQGTLMPRGAARRRHP